MNSDHHNSAIAHRAVKRETIIKHQKSTALTPGQVTALALELSRKTDQTISLEQFKANCDLALTAAAAR